MEALILVALVILAVLSLSLAMYGLRRYPSERRLLPPWIPAVLLAFVLTLLVVAVFTARWWNAVSFALSAVVFGVILLDAVRRRRAPRS